MVLPDPERTSIAHEHNWKIVVRDDDIPLDRVANKKNFRVQGQAQAEEVEVEEQDDGGEAAAAEEDEEEADDANYVPEQMGGYGGQYYDPRIDTVLQSVADLRTHMDDQFRLLNARLDAWQPYGWQTRFPPPSD